MRRSCLGHTVEGRRCRKTQSGDAVDGKGGWLVRGDVVLCDQHRDQEVIWHRPTSQPKNKVAVTINGVTVTLEI